jgi:hypothetical protein
MGSKVFCFFWQYWGLNSLAHTCCRAGALPPEPHLQFWDPSLNMNFIYILCTFCTQSLKIILYNILNNFLHETKFHSEIFPLVTSNVLNFGICRILDFWIRDAQPALDFPSIPPSNHLLHHSFFECMPKIKDSTYSLNTLHACVSLYSVQYFSS